MSLWGVGHVRSVTVGEGKRAGAAHHESSVSVTSSSLHAGPSGSPYFCSASFVQFYNPETRQSLRSSRTVARSTHGRQFELERRVENHVSICVSEPQVSAFSPLPCAR